MDTNSQLIFSLYNHMLTKIIGTDFSSNLFNRISYLFMQFPVDRMPINI